MKTSIAAIIIGSFIMLGLTVEQKRSDALISDKQMMQVGIIVSDIEKSAEAWTNFLGNEEIPEIIVATGDDKNPTEYKGKPSDAKEPDADGKKPLASKHGQDLLFLDLPGWFKASRWTGFIKRYREDVFGFILAWIFVGVLVVLAWGLMQIGK